MTDASAPAPEKHAYFIDSGGKVVPVPLSGVGQAQQMGWVPASEKQVADFDLQQKYGSTGQQIATGAEAALRAATLGSSTFVERLAGVPAEDIANRPVANPGSEMIGTGIGIAAPIAATAGTSAVAEGALGAAREAAELSAPSLVAKAGKAVSGAVEAALPKATGAVGRVASKAAASAAGSAVEGAAYGLGHVVHEKALGDPNLTAQSALEEIGLSGLLGGGIGAAGGMLGGLIKEVPHSQLGRKLADWLPEFEGERNIKAAGAIQSDINQQLKRGLSKEGLAEMGREAGEKGLVTPFSTPAKTLERSEALMEDAGARMRGVLDEADAAGAKAKPVADIAGRIEKEIIAPIAEDPMQKATANTLKELTDYWKTKFGAAEGESQTFKALHDMRKDIDARVRGLKGAYDPTSSYLKSYLHDARTVVADEINNGLKESGLEAGEAWRAANKDYRLGATIAKFAENGAARAHGNNLVSPTELLSGLAGAAHSGPVGVAMGLGTAIARRFGSGLLGAGARGVRQLLDEGAVSSVVNKTADAIAAERAAGADTIAATGSRAGETVAALSQLEKANQRVAARVDELAKAVVTGARAAGSAAKASAVSLADFEKTMEKVHHLASTPDMLQEHLTRHTEDLQEHAPDTAQAASVTAARAIAYLHNKFPAPPKRGILAPKHVPSGMELFKFKRARAALERPSVLLEHAAKGTLTPEDIDAVKTVHPARFQQMATALLNQLTEHKGAVPYKSRMGVALMLGADVDGTMSPEAIQANQLAYRLPSAKSGQDQTGPAALGKTTQQGLSKLSVANRAALPGQAAERRRQV